jgi:hypothetical protein
MNCDYCSGEFDEKELGKFKDKRVCLSCATNRSIPAEFEEFLSGTPLGEEIKEDRKAQKSPGEKKKDDGNTLITFAISLVLAASTGLYWLQQVNHSLTRPSYVFLIEGFLAGLFCRVLQKGRGGNYQNIAAVMVMASFFFPQMLLLQSNPDMAQLEGMTVFMMNIFRDFAWLIGGVFSAYFFLMPAKQKKKSE